MSAQDLKKEERLRCIVENAQRHPDAFGIIRRHATGILTHLGVTQEKADIFICEATEGKRIDDLAKREKALHERLDHLGIYNMLDQRMKERAQEWFKKIKPHLLKGTTLDLGGGSGEVAALMKEHGCTTTIADTLNWNKHDIPFVPVKKNKIDAPNGAFEQVVVLTVFHHTDDVPALVNEAFRLAKKRVIFIESVTENRTGYDYGAWIDWFYNRVIHYTEDPAKKINVPCNFLPATAWEQLVRKITGLTPKVSENMGIYQYLNPENHHLFVYDK